MKLVKRILVGLLIALVLLQFWRPEKNVSTENVVADFEAQTQPSNEVALILEQKCYDCHSNNTVYPWYAEVAPISLWIDGHIEEGREHFNVSDWASWDLEKKDHKMDELVEEVEEGHMPEDSYTWMHGKLSQEEKEMLMAWGRKVRTELAE
ncbi:heme-binding domain-containing protein [Muricauda sp. SCSIO 64092]|uniref:heme-binding domain-containing protein n=1 Tax=Allomuricauda sp. SCSIO 64092 TaxID=2908842 RepID=UPI001FF1070F|nr:heme-binding domain-containing protein [Muricauda sp. SCSIO 64092]UOY05598.1 heme-binding domain-containing protein [Muricauda sp. SCSIO 64092]